MSVNGFMVDGIFSSDVAAGKHCIDSITLMSSDIEENDIQQIEEIELYFHVFATDGWDEILDTEIISMTF